MIDLVLMIVRFSHRSSTLDVQPTEFWVRWFSCFILQSTVLPSTHAQQCVQIIKNKSWKSWVLNPSAFGFFCICWWCVLDWKRENVNANSSFAHVRSYSEYETCKGKYTWKYLRNIRRLCYEATFNCSNISFTLKSFILWVGVNWVQEDARLTHHWLLQCFFN